METVKRGTYGEYASSNYGVHCQYTDIGTLRVYFSYNTVVAFQENGAPVVSENLWGNTTGKHLNWISRDKSLRLARDDFEKALDAKLAEHSLTQGSL